MKEDNTNQLTFNEWFVKQVEKCKENQFFLVPRCGDETIEHFAKNLEGIKIIRDGMSAVYTCRFDHDDGFIHIWFIRIMGENFKITPLCLTNEAAGALFDCLYEQLEIDDEE